MHIIEKIKETRSRSSYHSHDQTEEQTKLAMLREHYERAPQALEILPYSVRLKPLFHFLSAFRNTYHFISVLLGIATCALVALMFTGIGSGGSPPLIPIWLLVVISVVVGVLLVAMLIGVEMGKMTLATTIFKRRSQGKGNGLWSIVSLTFLVVVSIALSGVGGALISYKVGDKSEQLAEGLAKDKAKVASKYNQRIAQLSEIIAALEALSVDKKARRWGLTKAEQRNLQDSKAEKLDLLKLREKDMAELSAQYIKRTSANNTNTLTSMWVALTLITLLELLTVYCYSFNYTYLARTKEEGIKQGILPDVLVQEKQPTINKPKPEPAKPAIDSPAKVKPIDSQKPDLKTIKPQKTGGQHNINTPVATPTAQVRVGGFKRYDEQPQKPNVEQGIDTAIKPPTKGLDNTSIENEIEYLRRYDFVVRDNQAGLSIPAMVRKYNGSPSKSTIQTVRRSLRVLRQADEQLYHSVVADLVGQV